MLQNMRDGLTTGQQMIVRSILPTTGLSTSTRASYNAGIQTAVNAYITNTGDTAVKFINTDNWLNPSTDTSDGIHPNATGYAKIANREIPIAATTGYTVSGPSSGSGLATSTAFTVTIASGATFTGDETVAISDGGNGGTFTPSVGTASSSNVTVTPTASTTAFTFTYKPTSSGVKILTFTNGQGWTDASSTTYTVSAASIGASPTSITQNSTGNTIAITGTNTTWSGGTPGTPTFTLSGGTGASITAQSVADATHATLTLAAGSSPGTLAITDPSSGATTTVAVGADTTPPSVSLTAPSSGATVSGSSVTLTATASDNVAVANVQFKVEGTNIGSAITLSPYTTTWISTGVADGSHTLYAVAEDTSGNYATSSIAVTVRNASVFVSSSGGGNGAPAGSFGGSGAISGPFFVGPAAPALPQAAAPSVAQTATPSSLSNTLTVSPNQQLYDVGRMFAPSSNSSMSMGSSLQKRVPVLPDTRPYSSV
jgi:hypothetical protein